MQTLVDLSSSGFGLGLYLGFLLGVLAFWAGAELQPWVDRHRPSLGRPRDLWDARARLGAALPPGSAEPDLHVVRPRDPGLGGGSWSSWDACQVERERFVAGLQARHRHIHALTIEED
jgi:hypothetical protein